MDEWPGDVQKAIDRFGGRTRLEALYKIWPEAAVSGAANIGAQGLTATLAGARGVVSATVDMVGEIAGAAQGTFQATLENARHSRPPARLAPARSAVPTTDERDAKGASTSSPKAARSRRRARRLRPATRPARPSVAA